MNMISENRNYEQDFGLTGPYKQHPSGNPIAPAMVKKISAKSKKTCLIPDYALENGKLKF